MENKVKNVHQARAIFDLLGIKDVTKEWQHKQGTQVFELPFKTMYYNGHAETNRFSIYKSGYVRKMVVHPTKGTSYSCYQLNKTRNKEEYYKDYDINGNWTGKYNKRKCKERIMIDNHRDRVVYLCNYILKNYYRSQTGAGFYRINDYQVSLMQKQSAHTDFQFPEDDIKVIINGHRYNLS